MPDPTDVNGSKAPDPTEPESNSRKAQRKAETEARRAALVTQVIEVATKVLKSKGLEDFSAKAVVIEGNFPAGTVSELIGGTPEMLEILLAKERNAFEAEARLINIDNGLLGALGAIYQGLSNVYSKDPQLSAELDKYQFRRPLEYIGARALTYNMVRDRARVDRSDISVGEMLIVSLACDMVLLLLLRGDDPRPHQKHFLKIAASIRSGRKPISFVP